MRIRLLLVVLPLLMAGCVHRSATLSVEGPPEGVRPIALAETRAALEDLRPSQGLEDTVHAIARRAIEQTGEGVLTLDNLWITVIDLRDPRDHRMASWNGAAPVYPASVVKLCYMLAAFDQHTRGEIEFDERLARDLDRMIRVSSNVATNRIVDRLSNTAYGPALEGEALASFLHKRQTTVRYLRSIGLNDLWAVNKTYDNVTPLYGRDEQALGARRGPNYEHSNRMTTDDTARLLYLIWRRAVVSPHACEQMLDLMKRDEEYRSFFSAAVPDGATLYSKGGSTDRTRHDAGIFVLPEGDGAIILVAFSTHPDPGSAPFPRVIQTAAWLLLDELLMQPGSIDQTTADPEPTAGLE